MAAGATEQAGRRGRLSATLVVRPSYLQSKTQRGVEGAVAMAPKRKAPAVKVSVPAEGKEPPPSKKSKKAPPAKIVTAKAPAAKVTKAKPAPPAAPKSPKKRAAPAKPPPKAPAPKAKAPPKPRAAPAKKRGAKKEATPSPPSSPEPNEDEEELEEEPVVSKKAAKEQDDSEDDSDSDSGESPAASPGASPKGNSKDVKPSAGPKHVVIEHCKQCNSFKVRALKIQEALKEAFPDIVVTINPEKPRRGCFEIREKDGQTFISLLNMTRPFQKMKDLDMEEVAADIVAKLEE